MNLERTYNIYRQSNFCFKQTCSVNANDQDSSKQSSSNLSIHMFMRLTKAMRRETNQSVRQKLTRK